MILALDPSSTRTGYALMTAPSPAGLVDGGLLQPKPRKLDLIPRVHQFAVDVLELIAEYKPRQIVIEVSTTCHGRAASAGHAATLGVYGLAVGYLLRVVETSGVPVATLEATVWTQRVPKDQRTRQIARQYAGRYDPARDPGGDVADAIGLAVWWLRRNSLRSAG